MSLRIFISDSTSGGTHGEKVKASISIGYGSDISDQITLRLNSSYYENQIIADINEAAENGYLGFIQCAIGVAVGFGVGLAIRSAAILQYSAHTMFSVMPLFDNAYAPAYMSPDAVLPIVICGAGDTQNRTSYGSVSLDFWDIDPYANGGFHVSFSTPVILGKLLKIMDTLSCTIWEARYRARMTASEGGVWSEINGYGKIDVAAAIAYSGTIPPDLFLYPSVPTGLTVTRVNGKASLTWDAVEYADTYKIYRSELSTGETVLIETTTETEYTDEDTDENHTYRYQVTAYRTVNEFESEKCASKYLAAIAMTATPMNVCVLL